MQHYHYQDQPEREPLDYYGGGGSASHSPDHYHNNHGANYQQQQQYNNGGGYPDQFTPTATRGGDNRYGPGSHPDSQFSRQNRNQVPPPPMQDRGYANDYYPQQQQQQQQQQQHPPQPAYDQYEQQQPTQQDYYAPQQRRRDPDPRNYPAESASGGITGIAYTVAERVPRESGVEAMNQPGQGPYERRGGNGQAGYNDPSYPPPAVHHGGYHAGHEQHARGPSPHENPFAGGSSHSGSSHSSIAAPAAAAGTMGAGAGYAAAAGPGRRSPPRGGYGHDAYSDDPYQGYSSQGYSSRADPRMTNFNPNDIADDGDDGLVYRRPARTSMLSLHSNRSGRNGHNTEAAVAAAGATAATAGAAGAMARSRHSNGAQYDALHNGTPSAPEAAKIKYPAETSDWLEKQSGSKKKWKWCIGILVVLIIVGAVVGGVVGGLVMNKKGPQSASEDDAKGDLGIQSGEIQDLLKNSQLKKVFPGIDYTPLNTQYPECENSDFLRPSQNNITRDIAVLSQLTNTVRLYGTDCNQTQMVVHAIQRLEMQDTMKVWIGVWQDNNATTNERQLAQMWDILDEYGADPFAGVIVANEILFREQMTSTELAKLLTDVKSELVSKGISLPVATSDLGDKLRDATDVAAASDLIMSNIHPFFAGVKADDAAEFAYAFWENQNKPIWKADIKDNVIAEIGWPSGGGTNCGSEVAEGASCTGTGSEASVEGIQVLLDDWVCQALTNGTNYFWFSAFDEPWKDRFNTPGKAWEDQWGLMDVNRNLKDGITIPDCGGRTI